MKHQRHECVADVVDTVVRRTEVLQIENRKNEKVLPKFSNFVNNL